MDEQRCEDCVFFDLRYADPSGYEAYCNGTKRGRMIRWQYGLDMDRCKAWLMQDIRTHKPPTWCQQKPPKLLPCPVCGKAVEMKWTAAMDKKTAAMCGHPLGGIGGWYIEYCPGEVVYESPKIPTYQAQQDAKKKLARKWNKSVKTATQGDTLDGTAGKTE